MTTPPTPTATPEELDAAIAKLRGELGVQTPQEAIHWLNILLYSEPGDGKTYFCGTACDHLETSPVLFLDLEGGLTTLRKRNELDTIQVRTMSELEKIVNLLAKSYASGNGYYKTVCLDGVTETQKLDMHTVMAEAKRTAKDPNNVDILVPSPREWGKSGERMRMVIRSLRDLPCNLICTALLAQEINDKGQKNVYPSIPGKLKNELAGFFDIVGCLRAIEQRPATSGGPITVKREIQFLGTEKVTAKDRTDMLSAVMESPSMPLLWDMAHA